MDRYPGLNHENIGSLNLSQVSVLLDEDVVGSEEIHFRTEAEFERWLSRKLK